jgi:hypothetical protein
VVISGDRIPGNGLGLEYHADVGRLYVSTQVPPTRTNPEPLNLLVFEDTARIPVPEPGTAMQILIGVVGLAWNWVRQR